MFQRKNIFIFTLIAMLITGLSHAQQSRNQDSNTSASAASNTGKLGDTRQGDKGNKGSREKSGALNKEKYKKRAAKMQWGEIGGRLKSEDAVARRAAGLKLASDTPEQKKPARVIKFIGIALNSNDEYTRKLGAVAAYRIAFVYHLKQRRSKGETSPYDITKNPRIIRGLKRVLGDSDVDARTSAIKTLMLAYESRGDLRDVLFKKYHASTSAKEKGLLIELFVEWDYHNKGSVELIVDGLRSESPYVQNKAVSAIGQIKPADAVDDLIFMYFDASENEKKHILSTLDKYRMSDAAKRQEFQKIASDVRSLNAHLNGQRNGGKATGQRNGNGP